MTVTYKLRDGDWIAFKRSTSSSALVIKGVLLVAIHTTTVESHGVLLSSDHIRKRIIDAFLALVHTVNDSSKGGRHVDL